MGICYLAQDTRDDKSYQSGAIENLFKCVKPWLSNPPKR